MTNAHTSLLLPSHVSKANHFLSPQHKRREITSDDFGGEVEDSRNSLSPITKHLRGSSLPLGRNNSVSHSNKIVFSPILHVPMHSGAT